MQVNKNDKKILNALSQVIFDKKGFNILVLDLRAISTMTDYCIIAEGSVDRHVKALYVSIKDKLLELGHPLYRTDGVRDGEWIVMDLGELVVHLFISEIREKYALEDLWRKAKIIDVDIVVSKEIT